MRPLFITAALLGATPAPAAAAEICAVVDRIVAASRETPAFATLEEAIGRGEVVIPGFDPEDCRVSSGLSIECSAWSMDRRPGDWASIADCPGAVPAPPPERRRRRIGDVRHYYSISGVRISFGVGCMVCAGPAIRGFIAMPEAGEPPGGRPAG